MSTVHSSLVLCCPLCTLKCLLFRSVVYCGSSVLKALPTCLYIEMIRLSADIAWSCAVTCCHCSFYNVLWDLTVPPHRSEVPRTQGADPPHHLSLKRKRENLTWHSVNQSPVTDELSFIQEVRSNVCVISKNQYLVSDICTAEPSVHSPAAGCFCCFLYFFLAVLHQTPHPGSFANPIKMQRCWPFEWDSQIFFKW